MESKNVSPADTKITPEAYERFFELSPDLMCIAGIDGRFLQLNSQWSRLLGYELSALEGEPFLQFVHPDDVPATIEALAELRNNQSVTNFVNRYRCNDGTYRWIEWRSQPAGGCIYAAARDITVHRASETELRRSVEQQKLVATVARLFATGTDFDSQVNQALALAGHHVGAGRAYVFVDSEDGSATSNTHEWCAPGVSPQIDALQDVPYEVIPSWRRILAGDYVLRAFAEKVSEGLRSYDILGRYGGEEFLAIFDGVDRHLAARLRGADHSGNLQRRAGGYRGDSAATADHRSVVGTGRRTALRREEVRKEASSDRRGGPLRVTRLLSPGCGITHLGL